VDTIKEETFRYTVNLKFSDSTNVDTYSVFINDDYYGDDVSEIQVNNGDVVKITITKIDTNETSSLLFNEELL
jgi:predicted RNA-binding protein with TRAM domain